MVSHCTNAYESLYLICLPYAFIIHTFIGTVCGVKICLKRIEKYDYKDVTVSDMLTISGGALIGVLTTPFYPLFAGIASLKFLYEVFTIN